jgi:NAD(P)-dependent dehydrogenase (short-subunit alcohol dehydrogenase family)
MDAPELRLKERTALLVGPLSRAYQSLAHKLTQLGGDVVLAAPEFEQAQRFANQLAESREINEKFGRAAAVKWQAQSANEARDMVSRAAEFFGGIDILIEGSAPIAMQNFSDQSLNELGSAYASQLAGALYTAHAILPFFKGRKRGRMVFLLHDLPHQGFTGNALAAATRGGLTNFVRTLAQETRDMNITINCLSQGLTEEYLLCSYAKAGSIQNALQELRKSRPLAQVTDGDRIADTLTFLVSAMGAGVSGQVLSVGADFASC